MRAPLFWIRDFTDIKAKPHEIARAFDQLGIEVEAFSTPAEKLSGVRVAKILNIDDHPKSDHLHIVDIDVGKEQHRVVCGAQNIYEGMIAPYAGVGADLDGFKIESRKIRGVDSPGMLCSERELGFGTSHEGIMALPQDLTPGMDFRDIVGASDPIFDLAITPNRPDAMCIIGLARELAAHFRTELKLNEPTIKGLYKADPPKIVIREKERCPRYVGWRAHVSIGDSPHWVAWRLLLAGLRPINNVVDVTNYVLLERNQPLHAFDATRIGNGVVVRCALEDEKMTTLDGVERTLTRNDLLICDVNDRPQAIAGIMGGANSAISEDTTEILLESAYFSNIGISVSSKRLGLRSDSSALFERGIDPNGAVQGAKRAMQLLEQIAEAQVADKPVDEYPKVISEKVITLRTARVNKILGTRLSSKDVENALNPIGLRTKGKNDVYEVTVPTFRPDVEREIDLIEEVGRRIGYQSIEPALPNYSFHQGALTQKQKDIRTLTDVLVGEGFLEAKTFPLVAPEDLTAFNFDLSLTTEVTNPLKKDESVLATTLLPGLLKSVAYNLHQGLNEIALFEIDNVFLESDELLPHEERNLAAVLAGSSYATPFQAERRFEIFDMTRVIDDLRNEFAFAKLQVQRQPIDGLVNGKCGAITIDNEVCGAIGEISPKVLKHFGIEIPVVALEISTDSLLAGERRSRQFHEPSVFPPAYFDLSFIMPKEVASETLIQVIVAAGDDLIENVRVFDLYTGDQVGKNKVSIALAMTLRSSDRTLTDTEVQNIRKQCIDAAKTKCDAIVRGEK
jgi:phenylalanyl-tRNA synthetase beta chain